MCARIAQAPKYHISPAILWSFYGEVPQKKTAPAQTQTPYDLLQKIYSDHTGLYAAYSFFFLSRNSLCSVSFGMQMRIISEISL